MAKEMSKTEKMRKLFASKTLDVEEMDAVAGGTEYQTADDSRFLNVLLRGHPKQCDRYGGARLSTSYDYGKMKESIKAAWNVCGVKCNLNRGAVRNYYYVDGKEVTQEQAMQHAMKVMGKQLKHSDWYWD